MGERPSWDAPPGVRRRPAQGADGGADSGPLAQPCHGTIAKYLSDCLSSTSSPICPNRSPAGPRLERPRNAAGLTRCLTNLPRDSGRETATVFSAMRCWSTLLAGSSPARFKSASRRITAYRSRINSVLPVALSPTKTFSPFENARSARGKAAKSLTSRDLSRIAASRNGYLTSFSFGPPPAVPRLGGSDGGVDSASKAMPMPDSLA